MGEGFPPPGYALVESRVQGIEVYAPVEENNEQKAVVDFKCPQCLATTAYSVSDGGLKCSNCGYYEPPANSTVGKKAEEFEFKVETVAQAAQGWGEARKQIECQDCYAVTVVSAQQLTVICPFCGSSKVIQSDAAQDVLRPRFVIPFKIEKEHSRDAMIEWMNDGWMIPRKLRMMAKMGSFSGIYLPFWTFDARTTADWRAQVGYNKTERYRSGGEWKTRTVVRWRWENGSVSLTFDDHLVSGTRQVKNILLGQVGKYNLNELAAYEPKYLAGWQAQAYDISLDDAWEKSRAKMREATRKACRKDALSHGGDHIRNLSLQLDFQDESWRYILLPLYLAAYTYNDEVYHVAINGQTGTIAGERPIDWLKVLLVSGLLFIPAVVAALVALLDGTNVPLMPVAALLFGGAILGAGLIISRAQKTRKGRAGRSIISKVTR